MNSTAYHEWLESAIVLMFKRRGVEHIKAQVEEWNGRSDKSRSAASLRTMIGRWLAGTSYAYTQCNSPYLRAHDTEQIARWLRQQFSCKAATETNEKLLDLETLQLNPCVPDFVKVAPPLPAMPKLAQGKLDKPTEAPWPYKVGKFNEHYTVIAENQYGVVATLSRAPDFQLNIRFGEPVGKQLCEIYEAESLLTSADGDLLDDKRHLTHPRDFDYNKEGITMSEVSRLENLMLVKVRDWDFHGLPQPLSKKEITMSTSDKEITVTTQTLINGVNAKGFTDAQIYDLIAQQEGKIAELEAIKNKPKRLKDEIVKRQAGIDALVKHLDGEANAPD